jgi:hypothetical protein
MFDVALFKDWNGNSFAEEEEEEGEPQTTIAF